MDYKTKFFQRLCDRLDAAPGKTGTNTVDRVCFERCAAMEGKRSTDTIVRDFLALCIVKVDGQVDYSSVKTYLVDNSRLTIDIATAQQKKEDCIRRINTGKAKAHRHTLCPQAIKVREMTSTLTTIFGKYDIGMLSLKAFRREVTSLGFTETAALTKLYDKSTHHTFKLREFLRALSSEESNDGTREEMKTAGVHGPPPCTEDILKTRYEPVELHSPRHTTQDIVADLLSGGPRLSAQLSEGEAQLFDRKKRISTIADGAGVSASLREIGLVAPPPVMESSSRTYGTSQPSVPVNPRTKDIDDGVLRNEIYALIRELDQNLISSGGFVEAIELKGVPIPEELDKLLALHQSHGVVDFRSFAKAFDPIFEKIRVAVAPTHVPLPERRRVIHTVLTPRATVAHDVVAWRKRLDSSEIEQLNFEENGMIRNRRRKVPLDESLFASSLISGSLACGIERRASLSPTKGNKTKGGHKDGNKSSTPDTNIISWEGEKAGAKEEHKGRWAAPRTQGEIPFGTEADLFPEKHYRDVPAKAPRRRAPRRGPDASTGLWFRPVVTGAAPRAVVAPFGTH